MNQKRENHNYSKDSRFQSKFTTRSKVFKARTEENGAFHLTHTMSRRTQKGIICIPLRTTANQNRGGRNLGCTSNYATCTRVSSKNNMGRGRRWKYGYFLLFGRSLSRAPRTPINRMNSSCICIKSFGTVRARNAFQCTYDKKLDSSKKWAFF